jgi:hypothetical protein
MDDKVFDRLSVVVHRLRDKTTRRSALGLVLGGSIGAVNSILADDVGARNRNRRNRKKNGCRGFGGKCSRNQDCCFSNCRSSRCWYGGGSGSHCGGQRCQDGWRCCNSSGVSVCVPQNYPVCCGNQSFVDGYTCCGGSGGACLGGIDSCTGQFGVCCQSGWKHCNSGFFAGQCIPNDWSCADLSQSSQTDGISAQSTEPIPTTDPRPIPPDHWIDLQK